MMNFNGQWQDTPDYREGWQNPHQSAFGGLLRALDPMTYIPGLNTVSNAAHNFGDAAVTGINTALSPMIGGAQKLTQFITPGLKQAQNVLPYANNIDTFIRNKPFDAAALAAATYFTGGAANSALASSGAPAASTAGGLGGLNSFNAAASPLITPSFTSTAEGIGAGTGAGAAGSTTGSLVNAGAISPMLVSGPYGGIAGASGTGTLGTVGTAAGNSLTTPSFASLGAPTSSGFSMLKNGIGKVQNVSRYARNLNQPSNYDSNYNQSVALGDSILNDNPKPLPMIKTRPLNIQRNNKLIGMRY